METFYTILSYIFVIFIILLIYYIKDKLTPKSYKIRKSLEIYIDDKLYNSSKLKELTYNDRNDIIKECISTYIYTINSQEEFNNAKIVIKNTYVYGIEDKDREELLHILNNYYSIIEPQLYPKINMK